MRTLRRRGISPLIATVLLMAFAVALGVMIMNWSSDLDSGPVDCGGVAVDVIQFCHDGTAINVRARNTGESPIDSLSLNIASPGASPFSVKLQESQLANKGSAVTAKVPVLAGEETGVELYANLEKGGALHTCQEPLATRRPLPKC